MVEAVVDTVVLRYFLLVGRQDLLVTLLGRPLMVPRAVFDPDEGDVSEDAMSEITRSILVQGRWARDLGFHRQRRDQFARNAKRLAAVHQMHRRGKLRVADLDDRELDTFGRLTSKQGAHTLGLRLPLGPGEAACIALAVSRSYVLATDDQDALRALEALHPNHPYERIRRLLQRAVSESLLSQQQAEALHKKMRSLGFRDNAELGSPK